MTPEALERGSKWLAKANLRPTRQRLSLATLLVGDGHNRHVTAESLHDLVQRAGDSVSLATVYNTLRAFCDVGLMQEVVVDGQRSYFDTRIDDHPHFFLEDDGRLVDAPGGSVEMRHLPEPPAGYEIAKIDVVYRLRKRN
ncbi:MAG: iron response transcriptional regulator IrrA [Pseudomonadota bacterium]